MNRRVLRLGAIIGAATVSTLAVAPAFAAAPVSQASSNALTLTLIGSPISSGTVKATNNGKTESKTGQTNPLVGVLGNQSLLNIGVLAQEATAKVASNGDGTSAACGGLAGEGASVVQVGDSNCLTPGSPVGLSLGNLNLSNVVTIDPASALGGLSVLNPILQQILGPITTTLQSALAPLGNTGLGGTLGAVSAHCTAVPGSATGSANIVNSKLTLNLAGTNVDLLNLPANPPPNTHLLTKLDVVVNTILDGIKTDLNTTLNGLAAPLVAIIAPIQTQVVNALIAPIAQALAPLEQNVLDVTLNKQSSTGDSIDVTALDLKLLPVLTQFGVGGLAHIQIGHVTCGPNTKVTVTPPSTTPTGGTPSSPNVPTVVDSGVAGHSNDTARTVLAATAALMLLAGSAGLIGYRRSLINK